MAQLARVLFCDIETPTPVMASNIGVRELGPGLCKLDNAGCIVRAGGATDALGWSPGAVNGGVAQVWPSRAHFLHWLRWSFDLQEA